MLIYIKYDKLLHGGLKDVERRERREVVYPQEGNGRVQRGDEIKRNARTKSKGKKEELESKKQKKH